MMQKKQILPVTAAPIAFVIDRLTKIIATHTLTHGRVTAIPGILSWSLTHNTGIAFSMFSGKHLITILLTACMLIALIVYILRHPELSIAVRTGLWMAIGGGAGNLLDRILYGSVIDFIRPDFIHFSIFNAADIFVCCGCAIAVLFLLINESKEPKKRGR